MEKLSTQKFDPEEHTNNVYDAFCEFVEEFAYEYEAIAKEPPKDLDAAGKEAWVKQNKRKVFLGKFATRNLQKDFEEAVTAAERLTITYDDMITALKTHYDGGRNKTLANYEFNKLCQNEEESFDAFVIRVKREAAQCDFKCASGTCTVMDIMIRDRIIIGIRNTEIRKNALKNQWALGDLIKNGRALEAATWGAHQIKQEDDLAKDASVSRIKKPGKYSRKRQQPTKQPTEKHSQCNTCSSKVCRGGQACHAVKKTITCFDCNKQGHFRNSNACKGVKKSNRVNDHMSSSEEETEPESSSESEDERRTRRLTKCVTRIRRMRRKMKKIRRTSSRYEVDVIINEKHTKAFADTGADISVMSVEAARKLNLKLHKTKMKIRPYGAKPLRCKGSYIGTIMHMVTMW